LDNGKTVHLLLIVESSHDAEVLASNMRNAGYAVRSKHLEDNATLTEALKEQQNWDLLISAPKFNGYSAVDALENIERTGKDLPCIIYGQQLDQTEGTNLLRAGARNCLSVEQQDVLMLHIERELTQLEERRAYRFMRNALNESEKRNRTLLDSSRDAISYIHEGMHVYTNLSYVEAFAYDDIEEMESIPIMDLISSEDQKPFKELLRTLGKGETPVEEFEFQAVRSDGEKFMARMEFSPASIDGEPCTQVVIHRKSDNAELEKELEQLRQQDLLTGLFNRQYFMEALDKAVSLASKGNNSGSIMYLEADNFGAIKDTLGIAGSDLVLSDIATLLRDNVSTDAFIARFAGITFTIIFNGTKVEDLSSVAEQIRSKFEAQIFDVEGKTVSTTCCIGIAPISETTGDSKKALSNVEAACAIAKEDKGNKVHVHTQADEIAGMEENHAWVKRIELALSENRFMLHFQPIISLHAEPNERYEVLLRMLGDNDEVIYPAKFMKAAENSHLMTEIDRWVLKNAAKAILEKRREGKAVRFFIKLSSDSLEDPTLLPWISKLLKAARLHGASLVFEISESVALNNIKATKTLSNGLKQLHCLFALDHVGNDNPTLSYLSHFKVDYLKLDGPLIATLTKSESSQKAVRAITDVARSNDILTIAQHVQDPECLAMLWQYGMNLIQGHYFQKPEKGMDYDFTADE
jgi:diguanylate cyclase (GGDEF)-like protein/PAS domain S-box-containing protein